MTFTFSSVLQPEQVFDALTDMQKFAAAHPLIQRIEPLGDGKYKVYERVKLLGFIPLSFSYPVTITADAEQMVVKMHAIVQKMTHLHLLFRLEPASQGTRILEDAFVKSPLPIVGYIYQLLEGQHKILFARLVV
jgi:carbon monoxide dehydrogenase subunit G